MPIVSGLKFHGCIQPHRASSFLPSVKCSPGLVFPSKLVSDNGPQLTSSQFRTFLCNNGIRHSTSAPCHPATNGLAKIFVQTFKSAMKAMESQLPMEEKLVRFLISYRNTKQTVTGMSPAELMFGKTLRTRLDLLRPDLKQSVKSNQKKQVDNSTSRVRTISVGERIMVRDYLGENKLVPGIVKRKLGCLTNDVELTSGKLWRRHVDQIRSFLVHLSSSVEVQPSPELPGPELEAHPSVNPEQNLSP